MKAILFCCLFRFYISLVPILSTRNYRDQTLRRALLYSAAVVKQITTKSKQVCAASVDSYTRFPLASWFKKM